MVDASVALAWVLADETTPHALALRARVVKQGALVPQHWKLEVCNGLLMSARRKRYETLALRADLAVLAALPILSDRRTAEASWSEGADLAQAHRLSVYDAAYLELAKRSGLPLATFDVDLSEAAKKEGVKVI